MMVSLYPHKLSMQDRTQKKNRIKYYISVLKYRKYTQLNERIKRIAIEILVSFSFSILFLVSLYNIRSSSRLDYLSFEK